jgi:hypothetical protein
MANVHKRRSERPSRRKDTLIKKSHEMAIFGDVDLTTDMGATFTY